MKTTADIVCLDRVQTADRDSLGRRKRGTEKASIEDWATVAARMRDRYDDMLRHTFQLGADVNTLEFEPMVARLLSVMPEESPLDRYMHASLIAQQALIARKTRKVRRT